MGNALELTVEQLRDTAAWLDQPRRSDACRRLARRMVAFADRLERHGRSRGTMWINAEERAILHIALGVSHRSMG